MNHSQCEINAVQAASQTPYELSATYSASLTMENDAGICSKINALRRIDGTVLSVDVEKIFNLFHVDIDSWARGTVDFDLLASNFNDGHEPEPVADSILDALKQATILGNSVKLSAQLEKNDYAKVNKIIEALGGKWNRKSSSHLFPTDDAGDRLADFIQTGKLDKPEKFGFFPTPAGLAKHLIAMADLSHNSKVLEPSAGIGNLALQCSEIVGRSNITCFEIQEKNCIALRKKGFSVKNCDFLAETPTAEFDFCILNPPFEKQQDIDHVLHAFKFLKPGGTLAAIMSGGISFRSNKKTVDFRTFLDSLDAVVGQNADDAFKESGTMVRTITVKIIKPMDSCQLLPIVDLTIISAKSNFKNTRPIQSGFTF